MNTDHLWYLFAALVGCLIYIFVRAVQKINSGAVAFMLFVFTAVFAFTLFVFIPMINKINGNEIIIANHSKNRVRAFSSLTNGFYNVFEVSRGYNDDWLAVVRSTVITDVDVTRRVVNAINTSEPFLVSIPNPVTAYGSTNDPGFAEVRLLNGVQIIEDHNPLKHAKEFLK